MSVKLSGPMRLQVAGGGEELPGLHILGFVVAHCRRPGGLMGDLLLELQERLVVLLLLLLLLLVPREVEEESQDGLQIPIPDFWHNKERRITYNVIHVKLTKKINKISFRKA